MSTRIPSLYVAASPRGGRGVFTALPIEPDSLIEVCPIILLPPKDIELVHQTHLHDYYFLWGQMGCAIALGYGSLYNHASAPNAEYEMDFDNLTIDIYSLRRIEAGEEITICYTDGEDERTTLWFEEK